MKKGAVDYSIIVLFTVIVALPILYISMTTQTEATRDSIGESQNTLLRAPYTKEDTINYIQKAAELEIADIAEQVRSSNEPCITALTKTFNEKLNKHIQEYNKKSTTKIPTNNYELYLEGNKIHAIAILPIEQEITKKGTVLDNIGRMWYAPSFTIEHPNICEITT